MKQENRGRKTNKEKGIEKKKCRSVYLTDTEKTKIEKKHTTLTKAILTILTTKN